MPLRQYAEIGAGQEVARWFFRVGGAAGTIAKAMSAYDMVFSDAIYGQSDRYVSRSRLHTMLEHGTGCSSSACILSAARRRGSLSLPISSSSPRADARRDVRRRWERVQPSDALYKKCVLIQRGSFRPATRVTVDMLRCAVAQFIQEPDVQPDDSVVLFEMTLRNLREDVGGSTRRIFSTARTFWRRSDGRC